MRWSQTRVEVVGVVAGRVGRIEAFIQFQVEDKKPQAERCQSVCLRRRESYAVRALPEIYQARSSPRCDRYRRRATGEEAVRVRKPVAFMMILRATLPAQRRPPGDCLASPPTANAIPHAMRGDRKGDSNSLSFLVHVTSDALASLMAVYGFQEPEKRGDL